jgi:hypothetical protein
MQLNATNVVNMDETPAITAQHTTPFPQKAIGLIGFALIVYFLYKINKK